jgi:DNA polymerase elongation subunit (family B)
MGKHFRLFDFNAQDYIGFDLDQEQQKPRQRGGKRAGGWQEREERKREFVVQMFGVNEHKETCCVFVMNYRPFFFVQVGPEWTQQEVNLFFLQEVPKALELDGQIWSAKIVARAPLYGFAAGRTSNFVQLEFTCMSAFNAVRACWGKGFGSGGGGAGGRRKTMKMPLGTSLFESNLPPLLRFFHIGSIAPTGWVDLPLDALEEMNTKLSTCTYEWKIDYEKIIPLPDKQTLVPFKICSFDIEATSSHGDFPVPVKSYRKLADQLVGIFDRQMAVAMTVGGGSGTGTGGSEGMQEDRAAKLFQEILLTAFGLSKFAGVDKVFPKQDKIPLGGFTRKAIIKISTALWTGDLNVVFGKNIDDSDGEMEVDDFDERSTPRNQKESGLERMKMERYFTKNNFKIMETDEDADEAIPSAMEGADMYGDGTAELGTMGNVRKIWDILSNKNMSRELKVNYVNTLFTCSPLLPTLEGDCVSIIGSTFLNYGEKEPYRNHCIVGGVGGCDPVPGVDIVVCETEKEMLLHWVNLITVEENPDIIIGYNILGFDWNFMHQRAVELGCDSEFLKLSRIQGEICSDKPVGNASKQSKDTEGTGGKEGTQDPQDELELAMEGRRENGEEILGTFQTQLTSRKTCLASGDYYLKYPDMKGRVQVDMLMYFRRDFPLPSYKLDDVAGSYICDSVLSIETCIVNTLDLDLYANGLATGSEDPEGRDKLTWILKTKNIKGLHVGDYIHIQKTEFTTDHLFGGGKFQVEHIAESEDGDGTSELFITIDESNYGGDVDDSGAGAEAGAGAGTESGDIEKDGESVYFSRAYDLCKQLCEQGTLEWGIAKDDVSPADIFKLTNGSNADRAKVAKYCIQDCNLVHTLFLKMDVLTTYLEMAKICNVPISFLVFRGQGIKLASYVAQKCRIMGALMPDLAKPSNGSGGEGEDSYEGAIVLPPKCAMYADNPVACNDFASLYPSIAEAYNLCPQSLVWTKFFDLTGKEIAVIGQSPPCFQKEGKTHFDEEPGYKYIDVTFDTFAHERKTPKGKLNKIKNGTKVCRWAQFPDGRKSIVPAIIHELLGARNDTKVQMKNEKDPFMKNVLDKRQLGLKVTANSLYGQFGSKTSPFSQKDVAASITAIGRKMITYVKRIVETLYANLITEVPEVYSTKPPPPGSPPPKMEKVRARAEYVYGDTDSVFFTFNLENPLTGAKIRGKRALEITITLAQEVARICTLYLPPPMKLAYEKTMMNFCLMAKKRYFGMLHEFDPNHCELKYMGLNLKRRDNCDYSKDVYGHIIELLKSGRPDVVKMVVEYIAQCIGQLHRGDVPIDKLVFSKSLRSFYKQPEQIAHAVLAERMALRDPGNRPRPGDRIQFVVVEIDGREQKRILDAHNKCLAPGKAKRQTLRMGDRIETLSYIREKGMRVDYIYYAEKQLINPIKQLLGLMLEPIMEFKGYASEIPKIRRDLETLQNEILPDLEKYMKKREEYCSKVIMRLLFSDTLERMTSEQTNRTNRQSTITNFFSVSSAKKI